MPSPVAQDSGPLRPKQRTAASAVVRNQAGDVLLVRESQRSDLTGRWTLPGGELRHGEHPHDAVQRELLQETGLVAASATVRDARTNLIDLPHRGIQLSTLRLIYDVTPADPDAEPRPEQDGTSDLARFVSLLEAATLPLMPWVAELLGLPEPPPLQPRLPALPLPPQPPALVAPEVEVDLAVEVAGGTVAGGTVAEVPVAEVPVVMQRPAAYAVLIDDDARAADGAPDPRILLTRLTASHGVWTLPGGGIDHGEQPLAALKRELYEETGLPYQAGALLGIGSRHFIGRSPAGQLEDFHGLRLVYAGSVPFDQPPEVTEVGGSSDLAAWIRIAELDRISVVATVREALALWQQHRAGQPR